MGVVVLTFGKVVVDRRTKKHQNNSGGEGQ